MQRRINIIRETRLSKKQNISLRKFPYPYKAALTISNDIDATTIGKALEMHKFLNTENTTTMGKGLGLEIGDSFWMYSVHSEHNDSFSYFQGITTKPSKESEIIKTLVKSGYLDCLHTYGNFTQYGGFRRKLAEKAIEELNKQNMKVDVWVNHGGIHDLQNIGGVFLGDLPYIKGGDGTKTQVLEYHTDITLPYGIRFMWKGDLTNIVGQDTPLSLRDRMRLSYNKIRTGKVSELRRPALWKPVNNDANKLLELIQVRDGQKVYSFKKSGFWNNATSDDLPEIITKGNLDRLKKRMAYMVVYTHLGKKKSKTSHIFSNRVQNALRNLAQEYEKGEIYVTTTSKLLNYNVIHKYLVWSYFIEKDCIKIVIHKVADEVKGMYIPTIKQLQGITFYTPNARKTHIFIESDEINHIQQNPIDHKGKESVSIPLIFLQYPFV